MADHSNHFDPDEMRKKVEPILRVVTSPGFLEALRAVNEAPRGERLMRASERLSPDALRAAKVEIPRGARISSRYFEEGVEGPVELADSAAGESVVNALNRLRPGLLDDLKISDPQLFRRIVGPPNDWAKPTMIGECYCVGVLDVCVGTGLGVSK